MTDDLVNAHLKFHDMDGPEEGKPKVKDLIARYLAAVERRLPKEQAKDIIAELRDVLFAKIEAREAELKREANADEVAAILKAYGHPVVVASKYSGHDYVIGPNLYPWFWYTQRVAVGAAIAIAFGIGALRALGSEEPMRAVLRGLNGAVEGALITFAVVTALFIAAERAKLDMKWAEKWNPKNLPRENIRAPKSLFETAITLFFDILVLLFWTKVIPFPNEIPVKGDGAAGIHFSSAWAAVYWPILGLIAATTVVHLIDLVRPAWSRWRSILSIAGHAAGLGVLWVLFRSQPLIEVVALNGADQVEADRVFGMFANILNISMGVMALIWAITIGVEIWRFVQSGRPTACQPQMGPEGLRAGGP